MLVQYVVGLCCMRGNPGAVQVELGSLVADEAAGKKRDVDVTVTISDGSGENWAFKAYEVKDEEKTLDVTVIEQLCAKLNDMPALTHRAIVSSSGFSDGAKRKAERHEVDLYKLEKWTTPIDQDFPSFGFKGLPHDAIPFSSRLLVWRESYVNVSAPSARRSFTVNDADPILDSAGAVHARYGTFGEYRNELLLRSTEKLLPLDPALTMGRTLPEVHISGISVTPEWPHSHTMDVSKDETYFQVDDLARIEEVTISGLMCWERHYERPEFRIMRRVRDGLPFAGALISLGQREGQMFAFVMSNSPRMGIHVVQLEEKHLNIIRQLSLQLPALE